MPIEQQVLFPVSGMDMDSDLSKVKEGDYLKARNIRSISDSGQTTHAIEPVKGNKRSFTIPPAVAQNKKYRFILPTSASPNWVFTLTFPDGTKLTSNVTFFYPNHSSWKNWFNSVLSHPQITNKIITGTDYIDVELEINTQKGQEYTFETTSEVVEMSMLAEAIPENLTGEMTEINSFDLNGNLFVWSTRSSTETERVLSLKLYLFILA